MQSTITQLYELIATVYSGLFIGLVYDALRLLRRLLRAGKVVTALFDLLFWALAALVAGLALFQINGGVVRLYSLCGLFGGALLYIFGFSPVVAAGVRFITLPAKKLLRRLCKKDVTFSLEEGNQADDVE